MTPRVLFNTIVIKILLFTMMLVLLPKDTITQKQYV